MGQKISSDKNDQSHATCTSSFEMIVIYISVIDQWFLTSALQNDQVLRVQYSHPCDEDKKKEFV